MSTSVTPHPVGPAADPHRSGLARLWYQLGPGSRERHARARAESQWLAALRYQWQLACQHVGLGLTISTPTGYTVSVPRIAQAHPGPPVSCTVRLRPGQRAAEIAAVAPRLAAALGVAGVEVVHRGTGWVTVVLVDPRSGSGVVDGVGPVRPGGTDDGPRPRELRVA